jgi:hypothetical protein
MKKIFISTLILSLILSLAGFSQKTDQSTLFNDVNISYGIGTIYLFTNEVNHNYDTYPPYSSYNDTKMTQISSPGTFMIGYNRMMNRIIMIGFVASYMNTNYKITYKNNGLLVGEATYNDNLLSGIAKITFNYVNKPIVRVYSSAGMGITVDLSKVQGELPETVEETERKILFAGQITFMGVRFGRAFGGFCEFGFGTNSIITAGFNYQFGD